MRFFISWAKELNEAFLSSGKKRKRRKGRKERRKEGRERGKKNTSEDKSQTFTHQNPPERIIERQIASLSYFILFFNWRIITLLIVRVSAIHQHELLCLKRSFHFPVNFTMYLERWSENGVNYRESGYSKAGSWYPPYHNLKLKCLRGRQAAKEYGASGWVQKVENMLLT